MADLPHNSFRQVVDLDEEAADKANCSVESTKTSRQQREDTGGDDAT